MMLFAALLLSVPTCARVTAEGPFAEMSFDAALMAAKSADKIVMIDFFTTWCVPCKQLDRVTWKDPKVVEWLGQKCVALKVDAEKDVDLAKRFKISAYPTIVFVKADGKEIDRLIGYRDGAKFLSEATDALAGKDALTRAKEKLAGHEQEPLARTNYARELARMSKNDEALREYLWCWDEGVKAQPAYSGVRRSFLLSDIGRLGKVHPPALLALRDRRDAAEARLNAGSDARDDVADVCALNKELGEGERTVNLYDALRKDRRLAAPLRSTFASEISEPLAKARRYADVLDLFDDPIQYVERQLQTAQMIDPAKQEAATTDDWTAKMQKRAHQSFFVGKTSPVFEALVGVQRGEEANRVAEMLIQFAGTDDTYALLVDSAARAGNVELAKSIADRGFAAVPEAATGLLRTARDKLPDGK